MSEKYYGVVGRWGYVQTDPSGITTYKYDPESGDLEFIETIREDIVSGQLCVDPERRMVYVVDEIGHVRGDLGGGGYVRAFKMDPDTGKLTLVSEKKSLSPEPCYLCLDTTKKYLLACHCADPYHVTKITKHEDGSFTSETVYDDTALVMFRVNDDGSLGDVCDVSITRGCGAMGPHSKSYVHPKSGHIMHIQVISRHHSVTRNPEGTLFAVCDRGMDKIYTYHLDRENGKLIPKQEILSGVGHSPRYSSFHPTKPYFYANNEKVPYIDGYQYDAESGMLTKICRVKTIVDDASVISGCCDILMHPSGKHLYSTSNPDTISVLDIAEDGILRLKQIMKSGGDYPRGISLSPDCRFLFSCNRQTGNITSFEIAKDGTLASTGKVIEVTSPAVLKIFAIE